MEFKLGAVGRSEAGTIGLGLTDLLLGTGEVLRAARSRSLFLSIFNDEPRK